MDIPYGLKFPMDTVSLDRLSPWIKKKNGSQYFLLTYLKKGL
jgi:hypothetical protein